MKNIENYLHLYLGCECYQRDEQGGEVTVGKLIEVGVNKAVLKGALIDYEFVPWEVKPFLRALSDMTEEENSEYADCFSSIDFKTYDKELSMHAKATKYLLSKHFDLFGLIEAGLAIDKSTLS